MRTVAMYTADRSDQPTVTKCRHFDYCRFNGATKREVAAARRHPTTSVPGSPSKGQRSGTRIRDGHSRRATLVANGHSCANARKDLVAGAATAPPPLRVMLPLGAPPPIVLSVVSSQDLTRRCSECSAARSEPFGVDEH
jgi:hypothetical protein